MVQKVSYEFDPFEVMGMEPPKGKVREIKTALAEFIKEEVLSHVGDGKSPVSGGKWKRSLSSAYRKKKLRETGVGFANLELEGDMLDAMEVIVNQSGNIEQRVKGREADKADGHNNHTGRSSLPPREFIPKEGQTFKRDIISGMKAITREIMGNDS